MRTFRGQFVYLLSLSRGTTPGGLTYDSGEQREMLKRNLIIVAVISLSIFLTDNTFGQNTKKKRTKAKVAAPTASTPPTNARTTNSSPNPILSLDGKGNDVRANSPDSAREAGSGNATGIVNAPLTPVNITQPRPLDITQPNPLDTDQSGMISQPRPLDRSNVTTPTPKARKSAKRKKP